MKPLSYAFLAAATACGLASAAETAYTTPVGYTTLGVPANTDTNISIPLQSSAAWAGVSTGISGSTVSVAASSYTAGQYATGGYMLQVTSGALIGRVFPITANTTDSVTVDPVGASDLQTQGFATGNSFVIRPFWTLDSLFPSGAGVGASSDPFSPSSLVLFNDNALTGLNRGATGFFFYYDGSQGGDAGWYDANDLGAGPQGGKTVKPSDVVTIRNLNGSPLSMTVTGEVPSVASANLVISDTQANDSFAQLPFPVDTSLAQSQLFESGAVSDSSDPFSPTDIVLTFDSAGTGLNPGASGFYFHYDGSQGGDAGWYDLNDLGGGVIGTNPVLKTGSFIIIRKAAGVALQANTWTAPLPYSL